jgi:hypothetical protein
MNPITWAKTKGPAYVGLEVAATICVVLLISFTVVKINNPSYQPSIDSSLIAVAAIFFAIVGMQFDKSDNGSNST